MLITEAPGIAGTPATGRFAKRVRPSGDRLSRLRALVLLSGSVRATGWSNATGRSVLDLPVERGRSLLAVWVEQAEAVARVLRGAPLGLQVLVDRWSPMPETNRPGAALPADEIVQLRVERDPLEYRGTGGLLRDLSLRYDEDDYLVVANGAQLFTDSLKYLVVAMASRGPDVVVVGHDDGTPSGVMWVRCGCLRAIPEVGFVDMKEQALPRIALRHRVDVMRLAPLGRPVRTPAEYVGAVRDYHLRKRDDYHLAGPFAETWRPSFSVVEEGADVDPSAQVYDSVVLAGGRVERRAVVVRSVVGPAGVVGRGGRVLEEFVNSAGGA